MEKAKTRKLFHVFRVSIAFNDLLCLYIGCESSVS